MFWDILGPILGIIAGFCACYWLFVSRSIKHIKRDLEWKARNLSKEAREELKKVANDL